MRLWRANSAAAVLVRLPGRSPPAVASQPLVDWLGHAVAICGHHHTSTLGIGHLSAAASAASAAVSSAGRQQRGRLCQDGNDECDASEADCGRRAVAAASRGGRPQRSIATAWRSEPRWTAQHAKASCDSWSVPTPTPSSSSNATAISTGRAHLDEAFCAALLAPSQ